MTIVDTLGRVLSDNNYASAWFLAAGVALGAALALGVLGHFGYRIWRDAESVAFGVDHSGGCDD